MTLTLVDVLPETEAWLEEEARKRGQEREMVAKPAPEAFSARQREEDAKREFMSDWQALSYRSLWEIWNNESHAVYDAL